MKRFGLLALLAAGLVASAAAQGVPGALTLGTQALFQSASPLPAGFVSSEAGGLVDLQQGLGNAGVLTLALDSASDGSRWYAGDNEAAWRDLPFAHGQVALLGGTLTLSSDLLPLRFTDLYAPTLYVSGGAVEYGHGQFHVQLFAGRNLIQQGPYLPFFTSAADSLAGMEARWQATHRLLLEVRYLHTAADLAANSPLLFAANPIPDSSDEAFLDADYRWAKGLDWLSELSLSRAGAQDPASAPVGTAVSPAGDFLSWFAGPMITRPNYDLQADYEHLGNTYLPLSNILIGDRGGGYFSFDYRPDVHWTLSTSLGDQRNNLENNPNVATFDAFNNTFAASYAPGNGLSFTGDYNRSVITTLRGVGAPLSLTSAELQAARSYGANQTTLRFQDFVTDTAGLPSAIKTEEIDQSRRFGFGDSVTADVALQQSGQGVSALNANLGANLALGRWLSFSLGGQLGHDLRDQTAFALTTTRTLMAQLQARLPGAFELSAQFVSNSLVQDLNPENAFIATLGEGGGLTLLPAENQRAVYIRLTHSFRWGGRLPLLTGVPEDMAEKILPSYGRVEGYAFDDRGHDGRREPGDEGLGGVTVSLDGREAITDVRGHFVFSGVRTGNYTLQLDLDHLPTAYSAPDVAAMPVQVTVGSAPLIEIPLQVVGSISGAVTAAGAAPTPFAGAALRLDPGGQVTFTDDRGRFQFADLVPGNYRVSLLPQALPQNAVLESPASFPITVNSAAAVAGVQFRFQVPAPPPRPVKTIVAPEQEIAPPAPRVPAASSVVAAVSRAAAPSRAAHPPARGKTPRAPLHREPSAPRSTSRRPLRGAVHSAARRPEWRSRRPAPREQAALRLPPAPPPPANTAPAAREPGPAAEKWSVAWDVLRILLTPTRPPWILLQPDRR